MTAFRFLRSIAAAGVLIAALPFAAQAEDLPDCPQIVIEKPTSKLTQFRDGPGRDITDIVLQAELEGFNGYCEAVDDGLEVAMTANFTATLGPAAQGRTQRMAYFVAVVDKSDVILNKAVFPVTMTFPDNINRVRVHDEEVVMTLPLAAGQTGPDFRIYIGFQVTRDQLEYNRQQAGR